MAMAIDEPRRETTRHTMDFEISRQGQGQPSNPTGDKENTGTSGGRGNTKAVFLSLLLDGNIMIISGLIV